MADLVFKMEDFENIIAQVPTLLSLYASTVERYSSYADIPDLVKAMDSIKKEVKLVQEKYDKSVAPFLRLKPEVKRALRFGSAS